MRVSGHKSESSIRSYSRRPLGRKKSYHSLSSACSVENLESDSTAIVAMHAGANKYFLTIEGRISRKLCYSISTEIYPQR